MTTETYIGKIIKTHAHGFECYFYERGKPSNLKTFLPYSVLPDKARGLKLKAGDVFEWTIEHGLGGKDSFVVS